MLVTEQATEAVNETLPMDQDSTESSPIYSAVRLKELELEEKRLEREERERERAREDWKMELEMKKLEIGV